MGTWGTGLSSNDNFVEVYQKFLELYNQGHSVIEITQFLKKENQDLIQTPEEANDFWFAIAKGQWECKSLDSEVLEIVQKIINSGEDLENWKLKGASHKDLVAREKVLIKFLTKLQVEKNEPRKRVKIKLYSSIFKKGDCLTFKMNNGKYGGAFVLTDEEDTELGLNTIAILNIDNANKPTLDDFKNSEVYIKRSDTISIEMGEIKMKNCDKPEIALFNAIQFKKENLDIEVVGQLPVYKEYSLRKRAFPWQVLKSTIPFKEEYIKLNGEPKMILKLSEWTEKHWL